MSDKYIATSLRLMRFLYGLGFDKESFINENGIENWKFEKSEELQESLEFFFLYEEKS